MEYITIILLIILILLSIISIFKNGNSKNNEIVEKFYKFENSTIKELSSVTNTVTKELGEFNNAINKNINKDFNELCEKIDYRLRLINEKVNEKIDENFTKTNKTFTSILERLSVIDEAQKKINDLSTDIVSLQGILTDKKTRGIFGEVNLHNILVNVFGENNSAIYIEQYTVSTGAIADCLLKAPAPLGNIAIDSKFPLENYRLMIDKNISKTDREYYTKLFKSDFKKHIDAISTKYIIEGETSDQAIMFLPAEAIFAEVNAYHFDLLDYAHKNKVWISSPTTLISTLSVIQMIVKNMERDKYANIVHMELKKLGGEFDRFKDRFSKLTRSVESVSKDIQNITITSDKITKRFDAINDVEIKIIDSENN